MSRGEVLDSEVRTIEDRIEALKRAVDRLQVKGVDVGESRVCLDEVERAVNGLWFSEASL